MKNNLENLTKNLKYKCQPGDFIYVPYRNFITKDFQFRARLVRDLEVVSENQINILMYDCYGYELYDRHGEDWLDKEHFEKEGEQLLYKLNNKKEEVTYTNA